MAQVEVFEAVTNLKSAQPAVINWNRLEARARTKEFDRSLRVEIHDALWMLTRQWQFGEFKGEDTGSAINAKVAIEGTKLNRFAKWNEKAVGYKDEIPLEARVERGKTHH